MNSYLPSSITSQIYAYHQWYDLSHQDVVPDSIWQDICSKFSQDAEFKENFDKFCLIIDTTCRRKLFLSYINHLLNYIHADAVTICIPKILWYDVDFSLLAGIRSAFTRVVSQYISIPIKNDRNFILKLVTKNASAFQNLSNDWKEDMEIAFIAIKGDYRNWDYLPLLLQKNKKMLAEVMTCPQWWSEQSFLPWDFDKDPELMLEGLKHNPERTIILMHDILLCNKSFISEAVKYYGLLLQHVPDHIKYDRKIVLDAVKQNWRVLQYLVRYRKDREIMYTAVCQHGAALHLGMLDINNDKELVRIALQNEGSPADIGRKLTSDVVFMLEMIHCHGASLMQYACQELKADRNFIREAMKHNKCILQYADDRIKLHDDFIMNSFEYESWLID